MWIPQRGVIVFLERVGIGPKMRCAVTEVGVNVLQPDYRVGQWHGSQSSHQTQIYTFFLFFISSSPPSTTPTFICSFALIQSYSLIHTIIRFPISSASFISTYFLLEYFNTTRLWSIVQMSQAISSVRHV